MTTIDIHTHMISQGWLDLVRSHGGRDVQVRDNPSGGATLHESGVPSFSTCPEMLDYALRIKDMDAAGIDVSVVSLTGPSVYWGSAETSAAAARHINDTMCTAQSTYPDRIRYLATLPWQHPSLAVEELARAVANRAVGVMVLANIRGMVLTDPSLKPIWREIDRLGLPVLVHPTTPPATAELSLGRLLPSVGFTFDTSLAVGRMILDGFLDEFPNIALIAAHGGGTLPYLAGRLDLFYEKRMPPEERKISQPPSHYLRRIYYDSIVYQASCLQLCLEVGGPGNVMFGTDYPHPADIPLLLKIADELPAGVSSAVKADNARRVFRL